MRTFRSADLETARLKTLRDQLVQAIMDLNQAALTSTAGRFIDAIARACVSLQTIEEDLAAFSTREG